MGVVLRIGPPDRDPTGKPGERERELLDGVLVSGNN